MKFLHQAFEAKAKDLIIVTFSMPTRVLLIHASQLRNYKGGKTYRYWGGEAATSPVEFTVPFDGIWHAVIEKGTYRNPIHVTGSAVKKRPRPATLNGAEQMETHEKVSGPYDDTLE